MSERPWYKRYPVDFIHGAMGLTLEEKGAYSILLDLIYDRGGPIPDDARYIAGVCNCSLRKWSAIRERLIAAGKIRVEDGGISNERASKEIENSAKIARERSENGSKGGIKRAENERALNENNELAQAELKLARAFQKSEVREDKNSEAKASEGKPSVIDFDPKAILFNQGLAWVVEVTSLDAKAARPVIGKWLQVKNEDAGAVLEVFRRCREARPAAPLDWLMAAFKARPKRPLDGITDPIERQMRCYF